MVLRQIGPVAMLSIALTLSSTVRAGQAQDSTTTQLDQLVERFFGEADAGARARTAAAIGALEGVAIDTVIAALKRGRLWLPQPAGPQVVPIPLSRTSANVATVTVLVPDAYSVEQRYPLVVVPPSPGQRPEDAIGWIDALLGHGHRFLIAVPHRCPAARFSASDRDAAGFVAMLRGLRQRFHIDVDRVSVAGRGGGGGDAAFMLALLYTEWFCSAVVMDGTLRFDRYGDHLAAIMLPNLRHCSTTLSWSDTGAANAQDAPPGLWSVPAMNRRLCAQASAAGVPLSCAESVADSGGTELHDLSEEQDRKGPDASATTVRRWFRTPSQGRAGWLRVTALQGRPWVGDQIDIATAANVDFDAFVRSTLEGKLGFISGTIDRAANAVAVETRRVEELEILLDDRLLDLDQPVTVTVNGARRFAGRVQPRIATLLDEAYAEWRFDRLPTAVLEVPRRGRVSQR